MASNPQAKSTPIIKQAKYIDFTWFLVKSVNGMIKWHVDLDSRVSRGKQKIIKGILNMKKA